MLEAIRFPESLGEYDVVKRIGRGGAGYVFEVKSRATGVAYAAKLIIQASDRVARERFRREAELLARCDRHPGVVKVHAFGETPDGTLYMIMDLVRGEGLDRLLEREERLEPRRAAALGRDLGLALGHAHALGVVHRDVKPSNVLLDEAGCVKLTDFGLATACDLERLTRTGVFLGTVCYCAPEQAASSVVGSRTDVFSVGCLLFHVLAGRPPLEHLTSPQAVFAELHASAPLPDVRTLAPSCPATLAAIVARAVEKEPGNRYRDGGELAADLARFLAGEAPSDAGRPARRRRHRRRALAAALALALVAGGVVAFRELERTTRARAALAASGEHLAGARAILSRRDRQGAPTESELVFALETSRRARDGAREAESLGASGADVAVSLAEASVGQALTALARRHLALGDGAAALAFLEALGPDAIGPDERLDRARALFLLGRLEATEAEGLRALALGARHGEALELAGDLSLSKRDFARAESAYAAALEVPGTRQRELHRKRGGAAALAGDDVVALAELAALVPDLAALPRDRAANEPLADLAPALYRRALAASLDACERDLDLAWRLAAPPPALAAPVAARWLALAEPEGRAWNAESTLTWDEAKILRFRGPVGRYGRACEADPTCESAVFWADYDLLWAWAKNTGWGAARREPIARSLLAASPRDPFLLLFVPACLRPNAQDGPRVFAPGEELAQRTESLALLREAIDRFPPFRVGELGVIDQAAWELGLLFVDLLGEGRLPFEPERVRRIADRGEAKESRYWYLVARHLRLSGKPREALEALDRQVAGGRFPQARIMRTERVIGLVLAGRAEEAIAVLQKALPGDLDYCTTSTLRVCHAAEEELARAPATSAEVARILTLGEVYAGLGRVADAEDALSRLKRLGADEPAAKLASLIERAKRSGG
jgi:tetratricopeptide (TPR) repeat protein